jgi:hypothetical protein
MLHISANILIFKQKNQYFVMFLNIKCGFMQHCMFLRIKYKELAEKPHSF